MVGAQQSCRAAARFGMEDEVLFNSELQAPQREGQRVSQYTAFSAFLVGKTWFAERVDDRVWSRTSAYRTESVL